MKKTTKVLSLFLAVAFIFTMMSLSVFAADYTKLVEDDEVIAGYRLSARAKYSTSNRVGSMTTHVLCTDADTNAIDMSLYSSMTIRYADGTFGGGQNYTDTGIISWGVDASCNLSVTLDANKIVDVIYTNHRYCSDSANLDHYIFADLYAGVDFPEEG